MTPFDSTITITLPSSLLGVARSISRALDPDVGGANSWTVSEDTLAISTTTPCTSGFKAQATYMLTHPEALHAACAADYATRWADFTPPTLEECTLFCAGIILDPAALAAAPP